MVGESEDAGGGVVEVEMMRWLFGEAYFFDFTVYGRFLRSKNCFVCCLCLRLCEFECSFEHVRTVLSTEFVGGSR